MSNLTVLGRTNGIEVEVPDLMKPRHPEGSFRHYLMGKGKTSKPSEIHTLLDLSYALGDYIFYLTVHIVLGLKDTKIVVISHGDQDGLQLIDREWDPESLEYEVEGYAAHIYKKVKGKYAYSRTSKAKVICDKKRLIDSP